MVTQSVIVASLQKRKRPGPSSFVHEIIAPNYTTISAALHLITHSGRLSDAVKRLSRLFRYFPRHHDHVQPARAVGAEDQRLLDVGGARRAGDPVHGARHRARLVSL